MTTLLNGSVKFNSSFQCSSLLNSPMKELFKLTDIYQKLSKNPSGHISLTHSVVYDERLIENLKMVFNQCNGQYVT